MTMCEWPHCSDPATHTVDISFADGTHETWQVCRTHDRELKHLVRRSRGPAAPPPPPPAPSLEVCCGQCQRHLDEPSDLPDTARQPCPDCGSVQRLHKLKVADSLTLHESLRVRRKQAGKGGWLADVRTGDELSRDHGVWSPYTLAVDREHNEYREVITYHDGTVLESRARLSDHRD